MRKLGKGRPITQPLKQFVVIAHEPELYVDLVFIVNATDEKMANNSVRRYYYDQGWKEPAKLEATRSVVDSQENLTYVAKVHTNPRYIEQVS
jgi:hypothetical protein